MIRQEQFKEELFALLRKYGVEMSVEEETRGYDVHVNGINFFAFSQYDKNYEIVADSINFTVGRWENGKE